MATKKSNPTTKKPRKAPARAAAEQASADQERPPESAEDFEHTLRRLVAARNRQSQGA
jgi:hypothetical protein